MSSSATSNCQIIGSSDLSGSIEFQQRWWILVHKLVDYTPLAYEQLVQQYSNLFKRIGKLKNVEVNLHIHQTIPLVAQSAHHIPFHMRKHVKAELDNLERWGIIEKVDGPTPWKSLLVIIPKKSGGVRLCVNMRMANKAINWERLRSPTVDDLIHTLNEASKLDLCSGYHQLSLAPDSRYITTFTTDKGLRRCTRLNFGTNSASEISEQHQWGNLWYSRSIEHRWWCHHVRKKPKMPMTKPCKRCSRSFLMLAWCWTRQCEFYKHLLTFFGSDFSLKNLSRSKEGPSNPLCQSTNLRQWCQKFSRNGNILCQVPSES